MESELRYNTPIFKDIETMEDTKLTDKFLQSIGFKPEWNDSLDLFVFRFEGVTVYDTLHGYKYDNTGIIIHTLSDLQREVTEDFGEPLEIED